ncbi:MAG: signal peptidase I [Oscillospiraceae bacterium]|nr:signal peptidase I [Oscillospiraceae bacterium]
MKRNKADLTAFSDLSTEELEQELAREIQKVRLRSVLRSTVFALVVAAAVSVLLASLLLPVLRIYGTSMSPTVEAGDIVVALKKAEYQPGDVVALYYENRVLVKRIIACAFDTVQIDPDGAVTVNGARLDEPYLTELHYGESTDLSFPCQVPEASYFVCGDNRRESVDSRSAAVGCIPTEHIVGKILFVVWPLNRFGPLR